MAEPFLGEIHIFTFNFAPRGYAQCDGQLIPIDQNQALYSLLGTAYGGDGKTTFGLPDMRGRVPIHRGVHEFPYKRGEKGGMETVTLSVLELPKHRHTWHLSAEDGSDRLPANNYISSLNALFAIGNEVPMAPAMLSTVGGNQPHNNLQPSSVVNFCIALKGQYPSRN